MTHSLHSIGTPGFYALFFCIVLVMLAIDMLTLKKQGPHRVSTREALCWSAIWVAVAVLFAGALWFWLDQNPAYGREVANTKVLEFFTAYVIEKALAVDNIFVFLLIFSFFGIKPALQRQVLLYGILGAIVLRALMVWLGALLVANFSWILYLFGAFLLLTGIKMLRRHQAEPDLSNSRIIRWLQRHLRVHPSLDGERFFTRINGVRYATPLFLCLIMIELSDLVFAVDSIPAVFAVTLDPFIVLTSNILAILGLRALYFLLADMIERFHFLQLALALVLCFIGLKMLLVHWIHLPALWSLLVVFCVLGAGILLSLLKPAKPN